MSKKITDIQIRALADTAGWDYAVLRAIIEVESGGHGFDARTGKIIIQFEPSWFKRKFADWRKFAKGYTWYSNGVGNQYDEWLAFNSAFRIDKNAAMKATSIGLMQVMGFHWKSLGFQSVGAMWDYAKVNEANQVDIAIRFCKANAKLDRAIQNKDFPTIAYYYNGAAYKRYNYDIRLLKAWKKWKK